MPTTKERKPCPIDLKDWVHTHTQRDIPVMKVVDPLHPTRPSFWSREGVQIFPIGPGRVIGKYIPVLSSDPEEAEVSVLSPPPSVPVDMASVDIPSEHETQSVDELPSTTPMASVDMSTNTILLHAELAQAVLRAAAWPVYGESHGHGQGSRGESADLQQQLPDGSWKVRVCDPRLPGGFAYIRVPEYIKFEVVEGEV